MKVAVSGGAPVTITDAVGGARGACWTTADEIIFNSGVGQGLFRVSAEGGEPERLTEPKREERVKTHRLPEPLPGGEKVLFTIVSADTDSFDDASIAVLSLETGEYEVVLEGGTNARYSPSGHLVYARAGTLLAVPFDLESSRVTGSPVPLEKNVAVSPIYGNADFGIAENGSLVYARGQARGLQNRVVWVDRQGREEPLIDSPGTYGDVSISPDGARLALYVDGANGNVWIYDIERATSTRLTFGFDSWEPVWSPDGRRVAFASSRTVPPHVFWQSADGSGEAEALTDGDVRTLPSSWSPDGTKLAMTAGGDIAIMALDGERRSEPFLQTPFFETYPAFSPDGRWIAYHSDESGRNEVYIRPFPSAEGKTQVSTSGGALPRWNPKGNELFYVNGNALMAVDVETGGSLSLGEPRLLFEKPHATNYDVSPDGERFAMIVADGSEAEARSLVLVQNWFQELERLVATEE